MRLLFHLIINQKPCELSSSCKNHVHEGLVYPVKQVGGKYFAIDQSKILLDFVLHLSDALNGKKLNPSIQFAQHYLKNAYYIGV